MRDCIHLHVNGTHHQISGADAFLTLSDFLRTRMGLCGTKIVCSEGDCGSCTVLVGLRSGDQLKYRPIDSCIRFVFQLDGIHVVSVEGLCGPTESSNSAPRLNSVQQAMVDCHGSQCGFCTPGFVVAMTGLLEHNHDPSRENWRSGLTGNLCRCTGYSPIFQAGEQAQANRPSPLNNLYDLPETLAATTGIDGDAIEIVDQQNNRRVFCPTNLPQALAWLAKYPEATIVAGATDIGVQVNKRRLTPANFLDLNRVDELSGVEVVDGNRIVAGARATWAELEDVSRKLIPEFHRIVSVFGSPQIRQVATIGGNIINASPIADSIPLMMICGTQLELTNAAGSRHVDINDFYTGYKQFDLRPGEILTRVKIPLLPEQGQLRLYKVSRRRDLDISTFTAAVYIETDAGGPARSANGHASEARIVDARFACGAVGPVVIRLTKTESFLQGRVFNEQTMQLAGELAVEEIAPISDVRGREDYRMNLTRNMLLKFYHQTNVFPAQAGIQRD